MSNSFIGSRDGLIGKRRNDGFVALKRISIVQSELEGTFWIYSQKSMAHV